MGKSLLKGLTILAFAALAIGLAEVLQGVRNDTLPAGIKALYPVFLIGAIAVYGLFSLRGNRPNRTERSSKKAADLRSNAGYLADYGNREDFLEAYSLHRLVWIGLVIGGGALVTVFPNMNFAAWGIYVGFSLLAISVAYWIFQTIMLGSVIIALLRLGAAVVIFAATYTSYVFDLLHMTVENDPSNPVMVSLFVAVALAISTVISSPKNKTAGV